MALFADRVGCALTRSEILKHVWGYDIMVTDRSVDRCVNMLRNKIEKHPQEPVYITTIRDIGYRFECPSPPGEPVYSCSSVNNRDYLQYRSGVIALLKMAQPN